MSPSKKSPLDEALDVIAQVVELVDKKVGLTLATIKWEDPDKKAAIATLPELSRQLQRQRDDFIENVRKLSPKDQEFFLSALSASASVEKLKLVTSILEKGGSGLAEHTAAKISYGVAQGLGCFANCGLCIILCAGSALAEGAAVTLDIIAEHKDQQDGDRLEQKVDEIEAKAAFIMDLPPKQPIPQVPPDSKPVSLTDIERKLDFIMDLPAGREVPTTPQDSQPVSLTDLEKKLDVTKKFYKFEGIFKPTFQADKILITMKTGFGVPMLTTGFVDLRFMRNHDVVTITTKVLEVVVPMKVENWIIWRVKTFTGEQTDGIKHFQDFADVLELPGDGVEILIGQSASASDFDPTGLIEIPYQFVVESITEPQFMMVSPPAMP
jgi:hypothetical protein